MTRRGLVWRFHLALGLVTGAVLLLISASGVVLVFRHELQQALDGIRVDSAAGVPPLPLQALADSARRRHPTFTLIEIVLPDRYDRAARVTLIDPGHERVDALVDPYSGVVLASRWQQRSPLHALGRLHAELYMGPRGRVIVGAFGLVLVVQAVTGFVLWWPFRRRRRLAIRWRRPWHVVSRDVHTTVGALSLAFNVPVALTGALLGLGALVSVSAEHAHPAHGSMARSEPRLSLDWIASLADRALPGGRIVSLELTAGREATVIVRKRMSGDLDPRGASMVVVDRHDGTILSVRDARHGHLAARLWALAAPFHFGHFAGPVSQMLYVIAGLTGPALVITGAAMWASRA